MPLQPSEETTQSATVAQKESILAPLHKVTIVSKLLAAVVFITLPFVGFWMGMQSSLNTMSVPVAVIGDPISQPESASIVSNGSVKEDPNNIASSSPGQYVGSEMVDVVYVVSEPYKELDKNDVEYIAYKERKYTLDDVRVLDAQAYVATEEPSLVFVASTSQELFFSDLCEDKCSSAGLYRYDVTKKTLTTMRVSENFRVAQDNWYLNTKGFGKNIIIVTSEDLAVIDLMNDTYKVLKSLKWSDNKTFMYCPAYCGNSKVDWLDEDTIEVLVYEYEMCDESRSCLTGEPKSTSTLQFKI